MKKLRILATALLAAVLPLVSSCDSAEENIPGTQDNDSTDKITITGASTVKVGSTIQLTANAAVNWKSSNTSKATVDATGKVTGVATGTVTITATSKTDSSKKATKTITITEDESNTGEWSTDDKDLMTDYLGEVLPYVSGSWTWSDDYYETYGCITGEASANHVSKVVTAFTGAGWTNEGTETSYGVTVTALTKDCAASSDYYLYAEVYYYESVTSIDVYLEPVEHEEWPTESINAMLEEIDISATVPALEGERYTYTIQLGQIQLVDDGDLIDVLDITIYDNDATETDYISVEDYIDVIDEEQFNVVEDDELGCYVVSALDKSFSMLVYEDLEYYAIHVVAMDYLADRSLSLTKSGAMIAINGTVELDVIKGADIDATAEVTWTTSDAAIATVNNGVVTGVAVGTATITATVDGVSASAKITVKETINDAFTAADIEVLKNIHDVTYGEDGFNIPYTPYFENVSYDEDDDAVYLTSTTEIDVGIFNDYCDQLEECGWEGYAMNFFGYYIGMYSAEFFIEDEYYCGSIELVFTEADDEDQEFDGNTLYVIFYDMTVYSFDEIATQFATIATSIESTATLPTITAGYYDVKNSSNYIDITAYHSSIDDAALKTTLEGLNYTVTTETMTIDPADYGLEGDPYEAPYFLAVSQDELVEISFASETEGEDITLEVSIDFDLGGATLVTDVNELEDGDIVYIVNTDESVAMGGEIKTDSMDAIECTIEDGVLTEVDESCAYVVEVDGDEYTFTNLEGEVLGTTGAKHLGLDMGDTAVTSWDISISADGDATITSTTSNYGSIKYNSSAGIFRNYKSGQSEVQIYSL